MDGNVIDLMTRVERIEAEAKQRQERERERDMAIESLQGQLKTAARHRTEQAARIVDLERRCDSFALISATIATLQTTVNALKHHMAALGREVHTLAVQQLDTVEESD